MLPKSRGRSVHTHTHTHILKISSLPLISPTMITLNSFANYANMSRPNWWHSEKFCSAIFSTRKLSIYCWNQMSCIASIFDLFSFKLFIQPKLAIQHIMYSVLFQSTIQLLTYIMIMKLDQIIWVVECR